MFTPGWKKEALHLVKGARKFVNYKRDLLAEDRIDEIESRRTDLLHAIKSGDRARVDEASKQIRAVCENALPREQPVGWFEDNVEVLFVAIVIALGLRAYYLQPFRIPTGSMQPTLNGITGTKMEEKDWPSLPIRLWEKAMRGRSYVKVEMDRDRKIGLDRRGKLMLADTQFLKFFSRSELYFEDSSPNFITFLFGWDPLRLPAPTGPLRSMGLEDALGTAQRNGGVLRKGQVLLEGYVDSGDLVLVNKFAYHFRKPQRGEVFVFDTLGIRGIEKRGGEQGAGSHYIKRLCGVPGDSLSVDPPYLLVDGKIAREPGIQRVVESKGVYQKNPPGYSFASPEPPSATPLPQSISKPGDVLKLASRARPGLREYAALGDNTHNSLDSRYWGTVKEYNLVGPALFSLWPITTGHWGLID
jgi:signal peptidase I